MLNRVFRVKPVKTLLLIHIARKLREIAAVLPGRRDAEGDLAAVVVRESQG